MFERRSSVIKDGSKLAFDYVPGALVRREAQMKGLETCFAKMVNSRIPATAFLHGAVGAGKTATAKRFCMDTAAYMASKGGRLNWVYVNCRIRNSEYSAVLEIVKSYDRNFPDRGFSVDQMLTSVRKHIEKDSCPTLFVLDEADVLLKNGGSNLIYQLSRYSEEMRGRVPISLMLISQSSISESLDRATMSAFGRANVISFNRYSEDELLEIVRARAEEALVPGALPDECAAMIASLASEYGDARFAIELLERSAVIAEEEGEGTVTPDCVRTAGAGVHSEVSENKLETLDMNHKITLLAISRCMKGLPSVSATAAEKTYKIVCEEYEVPARKHTQFASYISDLAKEGLVRTEIRREEEGGRAMYISIDSIPPKELAKKIEYLIETDQLNDERGRSE